MLEGYLNVQPARIFFPDSNNLFWFQRPRWEPNLGSSASKIRKTPDEYLPFVLQLVHTLRESVALKPAAASLRQGWTEARQGLTYPIETLWDGIDAD